MLKISLDSEWNTLLEDEFDKDYFKRLADFLEEEYENKTVYPEKKDIFNALHKTEYHKVKAVIIGQDPYHGPEQAHGMSFSVKPGVPIPPSLRNIYKELKADIGCEIPNHGYLVKWAEEGVLLLNTVLTVRRGEAHSHKCKGWEMFTDRIISLLNEREQPIVFILWGRPAQSKQSLIDDKKHLIITGVHPSPLSASRGFFGSNPFSKANQFLRALGENEIDWELPPYDSL
jgi:uracil-DNA glycosylase